MGAYNTARVLLPLVRAAQASLSLPPKRKFLGGVWQVEDQAIWLAK